MDRSSRAEMMDQFGLWSARALYALGRHAEALERLQAVTPVPFLLETAIDPLLDPRRLGKECRAAQKADSKRQTGRKR